jgi:hypothetical protein
MIGIEIVTALRESAPPVEERCSESGPETPCWTGPPSNRTMIGVSAAPTNEQAHASAPSAARPEP